MTKVQKPVWLITGCSTGLGAALTMEVVQAGHRIVATARNPASLSYLPDTDDTLKQSLDVESKESIISAFSAALIKFGRVDYVVNNASSGNFEEAESTPEREARDMFEINFWGSSNMSLEAIRVFRDENPKDAGGYLIQISSVLGRIGSGGQAYYSSSKFAIDGFIESLSKELNPKWNIKVLVAEPGAIGSNALNKSLLSPRNIHPAYKELGSPTLKTREGLASPKLDRSFPPSTAMAATLFDAVIKGGLPLRLPIGQDSWAMIKGNVSKTLKDLDRWREVSERPAKWFDGE